MGVWKGDYSMRISKMFRPIYLPIEIVTDILSRLPPGTLIRFTSVSKSWYALIRNPNFVAAHLDRNISNHNNYILTATRKESCLISDTRLVIEHAELDNTLYHLMSLKNVELISSLNGLLCLATSNDCHRNRPELFLWNPSIRKLKTIGPSNTLLNSLIIYSGMLCSFGFGSLENVNDCRIVRIAHFTDRGRWLLMGVQPMVEVYSLISDSWRQIKVKLPNAKPYGATLFYNGAIHWLGNGYGRTIISFDLKDEVFGEIMLPRVDVDSYVVKKLIELKGMLSFMWYKLRTDMCHVWTMRKYGDANSWTKKIIVASPDHYIFAMPFGFTKARRFIYAGSAKLKGLRSYDPANLLFYRLGFHGQYTLGVSHIESLLLLD